MVLRGFDVSHIFEVSTRLLFQLAHHSSRLLLLALFWDSFFFFSRLFCFIFSIDLTVILIGVLCSFNVVADGRQGLPIRCWLLVLMQRAIIRWLVECFDPLRDDIVEISALSSMRFFFAMSRLMV